MLFVVFCLLFVNDGVQSITAGAPESSTVPLCCPATDWKLARLSRGLFRSDDFICIPPAWKGSVLEPLDPAMQVYEKSSPVFGYGIRAPKSHELNSSVPTCNSKNFVQYKMQEDFEIPQKSCIMGIDGQHVAAIFCSSAYDDNLQSFQIIHKCCPNNYIYDSSQRKCLKAPANYVLYRKLFKKFAIFNANTLACPRNKVLVEYQLNEFKFNVEKGQLFLRSLNKKFDFTDYCIEAVVQDSLAENVSKASNIWSREQQFLIRTCDDILPTCRHMPCIRRCCNDGEMFTKGNATSYCRRDESDTTYHSFESLEISGNFTKPPGR